MDRRIARKLEAVRRLARSQGGYGGIVAVSGGLDSRLLAHVLWSLDLPFTAVHITGPHVPMRESAAAAAWLAAQGRPFDILEVDPLGLPEIKVNDRDRCYACKSLMFRRIKALAREKGFSLVVEGSHATDLAMYRPGLKALAELGVISPWALANLSKPELRIIARELCLYDPDQPSRPCVFTRLDYGMTPTRRLLSRIGQAEAALEDLGLRDFRLRVHPDKGMVIQIAAHERVHARSHEREMESIVRRHFDVVPRILYTESVSGYFDAQRT